MWGHNVSVVNTRWFSTSLFHMCCGVRHQRRVTAMAKRFFDLCEKDKNGGWSCKPWTHVMVIYTDAVHPVWRVTTWLVATITTDTYRPMRRWGDHWGEIPRSHPWKNDHRLHTASRPVLQTIRCFTIWRTRGWLWSCDPLKLNLTRLKTNWPFNNN